MTIRNENKKEKNMMNKIIILCGIALLGINACVTTQQQDAYISASDAKNLTVNSQHEDNLEARFPIYELLLAELSIRRGDNDIAVANYLNALDKINSSEIAERAVKVAVHANDLDAAILAVKKWQKIDSENYKPYQVAATLYFRQGALEKAYEQFNRSIIIRGIKNRLGFSSILSVLTREKKPKNVLEMSKRLADNYPKNAYAQYMFGSLAAKYKQSQLALSYLNKALAIEDIPQIHSLKAQLLLKLGRRSEAVKSLTLALKNNPKNDAMRMNYARLLVDVKQYTHARIEFSKLLKQSPDDADLLYTLGLLSLEANLLDDAEVHISKLLATRHRRAEAIYYLGRINESKKDLAQAVDWYQQINSGHFEFDAKIRTAKLLAQMGQYQQASKSLSALKTSHQDKSTLVQIYLTEASIFSSANKFEEAMAVYNQGLKKIPGNNDLLYARALTSEKVGRVDMLEQDILEILKTEPDNAQALNALGFSLSSLPGRLDDAYSYIKKAMDLAPDEAAIIDSMGWVEYKRGNNAKAEALLRKAHALLEDSEIAAHLVELLWVNGKRVEAKSLMTSVLKSEPKSVFMQEVMRRLIP